MKGIHTATSHEALVPKKQFLACILTGWQERYGRYVVVVALEGLQAVVAAGEVPDLDGHISRARH